MTKSADLLSNSSSENLIFDSFVKAHPESLGDESIKITTHRITDDRNDFYSLIISGSSELWNVKIEHNSGAAFRAALNQLEKLSVNGLKAGTHSHEASFAIRGVIEGFYGKPWSHKQRIKGISYFADVNMNHFMLAPKDDPWQRFDWRVPFTDDFLDQVMKLNEHAIAHGIEMSVSLSPGLTVVYSDPNDTNAIMVRYKQLHSIGIRHFGLLVDDIPWELQHENDAKKFRNIADAHAYYANTLYSELKKVGTDLRLTVCPLVYRGRGSEPYIVELGNALNSDIDLMWTGRQICSEYLDTVDAIAFRDFTSKKPFYWDNYPVNDVEMIDELHVGPLTGRQPDLGSYSVGLLANPMDRFELSLIAIGTIGDYLWDSKSYDSEKSWRSTMATLVVDKEDRDAISRVFRCSFGSCLAQAQAPEFAEMLDEAKYAWRTKSLDQGIQILVDTADQMKSDTERILSQSFTLPEWRTEALPWIQKYSDGEKALRGIIEVLKVSTPTQGGRLRAPAGSRDKLWTTWNSLSRNQTRLFGGSFILFIGELAAEIADEE